MRDKRLGKKTIRGDPSDQVTLSFYPRVECVLRPAEKSPCRQKCWLIDQAYRVPPTPSDPSLSALFPGSRILSGVTPVIGPRWEINFLHNPFMDDR